MKKISTLLAIFSAVFFASIFISCSEKKDDEITLKKPDIQLSDSSITVSISRNAEAKYVNILRKEIVSSDSEKPVTMNIGEIIPHEDDNCDAYVFIDNLIVQNKKYSYCARYFINNRYTYSDWTSWPTNSNLVPVNPPANAAFASDDDLSLNLPESIVPDPISGDTRNAFFLYDNQNSILTITDVVPKMPAFDGYDLALVLSYKKDGNEITRAFKIIDNEIISDKSSVFIQNEQINLRLLLSKNFFDRDISIKGLLFQKSDIKFDDKTTERKVLYEKVFYSQLKQIDVFSDEAEPKKLTKINVPSNSDNDGMHDFAENKIFLNE